MPTTIYPKATRRLLAAIKEARVWDSQPHDPDDPNAPNEGRVPDNLTGSGMFLCPPTATRGYQLNAEQERQIQAFIDSQTACAKFEFFSAKDEPFIPGEGVREAIRRRTTPDPEEADPDVRFEIYDIAEAPPAPTRCDKKLARKIRLCCQRNDLRVGQLLANAVREEWGDDDPFNLPDATLRNYIDDLERKREARIFEENADEFDTNENRGI